MPFEKPFNDYAQLDAQGHALDGAGREIDTSVTQDGSGPIVMSDSAPGVSWLARQRTAGLIAQPRLAVTASAPDKPKPWLGILVVVAAIIAVLLFWNNVHYDLTAPDGDRGVGALVLLAFLVAIAFGVWHTTRKSSGPRP